RSSSATYMPISRSATSILRLFIRDPPRDTQAARSGCPGYSGMQIMLHAFGKSSATPIKPSPRSRRPKSSPRHGRAIPKQKECVMLSLKQKSGLVLGLAALMLAPIASAETWSDVKEHRFPVADVNELAVLNLAGSVVVKGSTGKELVVRA